MSKRTGENAGGDFRYVTPTASELADWRKKYGGKPRNYRGECKACGKRVWLSGVGIGSHRRACKGAPTSGRFSVVLRFADDYGPEHYQVTADSPELAVTKACRLERARMAEFPPPVPRTITGGEVQDARNPFPGVGFRAWYGVGAE
jgi:hypothetical protein